MTGNRGLYRGCRCRRFGSGQRCTDEIGRRAGSEDDGSRDDPLLGNIVAGTDYQLDFEGLGAAPTRIVLAAGAKSEGIMTQRAALAIAERLGTTPVTFPSDHGGFLGGEYGQTGDPEAFAATLRQVLAEA